MAMLMVKKYHFSDAGKKISEQGSSHVLERHGYLYGYI